MAEVFIDKSFSDENAKQILIEAYLQEKLPFAVDKTTSVVRFCEGGQSLPLNIDNKYVVRMPRSQATLDEMRQESKITKVCSEYIKDTNISNVEIYNTGEYSIAVHKAINGKTMDMNNRDNNVKYETLTPAQKDILAKDLAIFLSQIHSIPLNNENIPNNTISYYNEKNLDINKDIMRQYGINFMDYIPDEKEDVVCCHNDLHGRNIAIDETKDHVLQGVFDFGMCGYNNRSADFVKLYTIDAELGSKTIAEYNKISPQKVSIKNVEGQFLSWVATNINMAQSLPTEDQNKIISVMNTYMDSFNKSHLPSAEAMYEEYINDVIARNQKAEEYNKKLQEETKSMSFEEIRERLKQNYIDEGIYNPKGFDGGIENFKSFEKNAPINIVLEIYKDRQDVKDILMSQETGVRNIRTTLKDEKEQQKQIENLKTINFIKLDNIYKELLPEIEEKGYMKEGYTKLLCERETNTYARSLILQDLNQGRNGDVIAFDEEKDVGNCTKSIAVSLYNIQKKYGIQLFPDLDKAKPDADSISHPNNLVPRLEKYIKKSDTGHLKDIEDIKVGDMIVLTRAGGKLGHVMMCHAMDKDNEPLLMGFSPTNKEVKAYESKSGRAREGIVIDVKSFIRDKVLEQQTEKQSVKVKPMQKQR